MSKLQQATVVTFFETQCINYSHLFAAYCFSLLEQIDYSKCQQQKYKVCTSILNYTQHGRMKSKFWLVLKIHSHGHLLDSF